jgi:trimethylamine--corrinoid protein Co-methyltransferase
MVTPEAEALPAMKEMAAACGAADSWGIYAMPTPPLIHGRDSVEILVSCAQLDVPVAYATALLPGATAPASRAGFVVLGNAETLSGLVITQLAKPGAPYIYGVAQGSMNLRTSHVLYNAPESYAVQTACVNLASSYGLPSFGYGGVSDSQILDEQWALESGLSLLAVALSGVTLLHDLGYVASGTASSHEAVVLMDEVVRWVKAYVEGVPIDPDALAVEEIAAVGPGGTHLSRKYTRSHYRSWLVSDLLSQQSHEAWEATGGRTLLDRVAERTRELRESPRQHELGTDAISELHRLVEQVRRLRESS